MLWIVVSEVFFLCLWGVSLGLARMQARSTVRLGRFHLYLPNSLLSTSRVPRILNALSGYRPCVAVGLISPLANAMDEQLTTSWRLIWMIRLSVYANFRLTASAAGLLCLLLFWSYILFCPYFPAGPPSDIRAFPLSALDGERATDVGGRVFRVSSLMEKAPISEAVPLLRDQDPGLYVAVRILE